MAIAQLSAGFFFLPKAVSLFIRMSKYISPKGTSIKDVFSEGDGGGYEKLQIGETFKA